MTSRKSGQAVKQIPPPTRTILTRRTGAYKGALKFDMIGPLTGMAFVQSQHGAKGDPAIYGPALARRGGLNWNPLGFVWEKQDFKKTASQKLETALQAALDDKTVYVASAHDPVSFESLAGFDGLGFGSFED